MVPCRHCRKDLGFGVLDRKVLTYEQLKNEFPDIAPLWRMEAKKGFSFEVGCCPHCGGDLTMTLMDPKV